MKNYFKVFFIAVLLTILTVPSQSSSDSAYEYKVDWSGVQFWLRLDLTDARIAPSLDHDDILEIPVEIEIIDMGGRTSVCFDKITFCGEHAGFDSKHQLNSREFTRAGETFNDLSILQYDPGKLSWIEPGSTVNENITFEIFGRVNDLAMPAFSGSFKVPITAPSSSLSWECAIKSDELGGIIYEYEPFAIEFTLKNTGRFPIYIKEYTNGFRNNKLRTMEPGETYSKVNNFSGGYQAGNYTTLWKYRDDCGTGADGYVYYITYTGYQGKLPISHPFTVLKRSISWLTPEQITLSKPNKSISISGTITRVKENETVNLMIIDPNGNTFSTRNITTRNGTFNEVFTPDSIGNWGIVAKHKLYQRFGNWIYESWTTYINVALEERKLSIHVNPVKFELNNPVNVSGTITPYSDIVGDKIAISYQAGHREIHNVTIREDGTFTDTFIPRLAGTWKITAGYGLCSPCVMNSPTIRIRTCGGGGMCANDTYFDLNEPVGISIITDFDGYFYDCNQNASDTLTITIIKPDGNITTETMPAEDGITHYSFIPAQPGKWEVKSDWSGILNICTFIVQNETWEGPENDGKHSIPGFEGVLMIESLLIVYYLNKRYRRK